MGGRDGKVTEKGNHIQGSPSCFIFLHFQMHMLNIEAIRPASQDDVKVNELSP